MSSTFSALKFELIGNGEQSGTWGTTTNSNIGTAIEQAIVGMATLDSGDFTANVATLTLTNTNAAQDARALCLNIAAGAVSAAGTINVPAIEKPYIVINGSSFTVTVKVSGLTGVAVPAGTRTVVYNNGTDVGTQLNWLGSLTLGAALPFASGGTGQTTRQAAMDALAGAVTSGQYLRGDGTDVVMSAIQAADVPTLNQNTTGNAATATTATNVSGGTASVTTLSASGVATFSAGTVSAPAITTTGDTNTGIFFPAADTIAFGTNGTEDARFSVSGSFSIGNTTDNGAGRNGFTGTTFSPNITLTDAATVAWNTALGQVATFTFVSTNRTVGAPTNLVNGAFYALAVIQNAGSNTLTWNSVFKWASGVAPTLSTAAGAQDYFVFRSNGTNLYEQGRSQGVA